MTPTGVIMMNIIEVITCLAMKCVANSFTPACTLLPSFLYGHSHIFFEILLKEVLLDSTEHAHASQDVIQRKLPMGNIQRKLSNSSCLNFTRIHSNKVFNNNEITSDFLKLFAAPSNERQL